MTEFPDDPVFGTSGLWTLTGEYRPRVNPNRTWWNAWIEPKTIIQARMTKQLNKSGDRFYKWSSVNSRYLVEDSED